MVHRRNPRHLVTTEEQGVLALTSQRTDETLGYRVVNAVRTVMPVSKELSPESVHITKGFLHQLTARRVTVTLQGIQLAPKPDYDFLSGKAVAANLYLLRRELAALILSLLLIQLADTL